MTSRRAARAERALDGLEERAHARRPVPARQAQRMNERPRRRPLAEDLHEPPVAQQVDDHEVERLDDARARDGGVEEQVALIEVPMARTAVVIASPVTGSRNPSSCGRPRGDTNFTASCLARSSGRAGVPRRAR